MFTPNKAAYSYTKNFYDDKIPHKNFLYGNCSNAIDVYK